jgi:hypothetical protein
LIGLANLPDGAHTLKHPRGLLWLLVRQGRLVRAELYVPVLDRIEVWPADVLRAWAVNAPLAGRRWAKEVRTAAREA